MSNAHLSRRVFISAAVAAAALLGRIFTGQHLQASARRRLEGWMVECTTGLARLRAGLPETWRVGDKTGTGAAGETNDLAIVRAPGRPAAFIAAYYVAPTIPHRQREAVLAQAGALIARRIQVR